MAVLTQMQPEAVAQAEWNQTDRSLDNRIKPAEARNQCCKREEVVVHHRARTPTVSGNDVHSPGRARNLYAVNAWWMDITE
jgi:hypothetical protein